MTDPLPFTPAWIASRLTPAQRAVLMWLPEDGSERAGTPRLTSSLICLGALTVLPDVTVHLARSTGEFRVVERAYIYDWRATPLGLRVRAVVAGGVG